MRHIISIRDMDREYIDRLIFQGERFSSANYPKDRLEGKILCPSLLRTKHPYKDVV